MIIFYFFKSFIFLILYVLYIYKIQIFLINLLLVQLNQIFYTFLFIMINSIKNDTDSEILKLLNCLIKQNFEKAYHLFMSLDQI